MKRLFLLISLCSFCLLSTCNSLMAYQWPLRGSTGSHFGPFPIRGTFGEYRTGNQVHLHDGVDIDATQGTAIYPIDGGTVTLTSEQIEYLKSLRGRNDEYLRIGTFAYVHISINNDKWDDLSAGLSVTFTAFDTVIGTTNSRNHLHLIEGQGSSRVNPLRQGGLDNYIDAARTYVYSLDFYKDTDNTQSLTDTDSEGRIKLSGKVDILSWAKDSLSFSTSTIGAPYIVGYLVKNESGSVVVNNPPTIKFDNVNGDVTKIYNTQLSNEQTFYYWVTNNKSSNGSLDTTSLPDGKYTVSVYADDIIGDQVGPKKYNIDNSWGAMTKKVVIDNQPNVEKTAPENGSYNVSPTDTITITFDREMDMDSVQSAISIEYSSSTSSGTLLCSSAGISCSLSSDKKILTISGLSDNTDYTVTVKETAKDVKGNQLDGDDDGNAGGDYTFTLSTITASINITSIGDGSSQYVKEGPQTITAQLVDDKGNPIATKTPVSLEMVMPDGSIQVITFTQSDPSGTTWIATIIIKPGSGKVILKGKNTPVKGITTFTIDTIAPKIESVPVTKPYCNCQSRAVAFKYNATDSGSGIATITPIGLGLSVSGCFENGTYQYGATITDNAGNTTTMAKEFSVYPPPGCDHPDDNYSVSASAISESGVSGQSPEVLILQNGFYDDFSSVMDKFSRSSEYVDIGNLAIDTSKPLVIPSAGLYGMENSAFLKAALDEYVKSGGTLIVMAQQNGYEYSALPTPDGKPITAYGWTEDQSCQNSSSYIDTYHQVLSSISRSTPSINVDGYFTSYPENSTVLLRRTANGQPAAIMYQYGNGYVIATDFYSDFGYGSGQASAEEIALIRDIITWAKKPAQLPEIKPGETVSVTVPVANKSTTDAASVKISIYDPDRKNVVSEQIVSETILAGESAEIPISYTALSTAALGIYHIDTEIFYSVDNTIKTETDSGRFVVSNPPSNPYQNSDLNGSISTTSETIYASNNAVVNVTLWNNTDKDEKLKLYQDWSHDPAIFLEEITVPAKSFISKNYILPTTPPWGAGIYSAWIHVFSERGLKFPSNMIMSYNIKGGDAWPYSGSFSKGFKVINPLVNVEIKPDKSIYKKTETVGLILNIQNKQSLGLTSISNIKITDPSNSIAYNTSLRAYP